MEIAAENIVNGTPTMEFSFSQAGGREAVIEVPDEQIWLDFQFCFYATVFTPRVCGTHTDDGSDLRLWQNYMQGIQLFLVDLVGVAYRTRFPFTPFAPNSTTAFCYQDAWYVFTEILTCNLNEILQQYGISSFVDTSSESTMHSYSIPSSASNTTEIDIATSKKRRHMAAPLDISEVRRSVRATRYMGFKASSLADAKKKVSHVKARVVPVIADMECDTEHIEPDETSKPVPPPTPIKLIQQVGTNLCGIPEVELTEKELLKAPRGPTTAASSK